MREAVETLWPELAWIRNEELREKVLRTWVKAFELSPLTPDDLNEIPFTLLVPDCPATFMEHKRCVVHIARRSAEAMDEFLGRGLPIDQDVVIAGAILADVGKLLEYEKIDGKAVQSHRGKALRHPFTGVHLAMACGVPVITTPNCGAVVRDGVDGFIVPIRDAAAIADKVELLLSDRALRARMGENARARAREFTWERYGERLLGALHRLAS